MEGKIRELPRDKVIRILKRNGFVLKKGKGPHMKFKKYEKDKTLTTFVSHCPKIIPFSIRNIIRQSKKPEEDFY